MNFKQLIKKYEVPAPRYTSYPTVPYWSDSPTISDWELAMKRSIQNEDSKLALYLHIPFCETLCSFCGCNTSITKNHDVEEPYIQTILKEFNYYIDKIENLKKREVCEIHLGGGSPTYLTEKNLENLLSNLLRKLTISNLPEFSIEVDPRRLRKSQLEILKNFGFKRVSLGVQDFNEQVQKLINRFQPFEMTKTATENARKLGYNSINFDLIYGLPNQTKQSITETIQKTIELEPDRIAFYSYAHVPWIKSAQRLFTETDLPKADEKRELYEIGREIFEKNGYKEIGMDHFSKESDELWKAYQNGTLHRNFMGYTPKKTDLLLGLGVSAISDTFDCFYQNEKILKRYNQNIESIGYSLLRGHKLNEEDIKIRNIILNLTTKFHSIIPSDFIQDSKVYLQEMEDDNLIEWENEVIYITEKGRPFLRNVCMGFDLRLKRNKPSSELFSKSI